MLRGIKFRAGRSLLVLLLAAVSTAAAVVAAGYLRAAQQSVLTDGLRSAPAYATSVVVSDVGTDASNAPAIDQAHLAINQALASRSALMADLARPISAADTDSLLDSNGGKAMARLSYRESVCEHVRIDGDCPTGDDEVMISKRSAEELHLKVGDSVTATYGVEGRSEPRAGARTQRLTIVGLYEVKSATDPYWGGNAYFVNGADPTGMVPRRLDAVFTPSEEIVRFDPQAQVTTHLELALRSDNVTVDGVPALRQQLKEFGQSVKAANLTIATALPQTLDDVAAQQRDLSRTVPVVAVPLLLLCLFVLFLVVSALTDERAPEIALAKLRGFSSGRATRFGIGEVLTLIVLAAPLGVLLGLALVELAAKTLLATGVEVELRWPVFVAGFAAMVAGGLAATLAARRTLGRGVLGLLRRVPDQRTGWKAGVGELVAIVAVVGSLVAAYENRTSALALAAAPLLAVVAGLLAARLLAIAARVQLRTAARRGKIAGVLAGARLARQPGRHRVIVVVTVAVALLVFGATAWDVGSAARSDAASDTLGAERVYSVLAPYPSALVSAVNAADPSGNSMAVVRSRQQYAGSQVDLLGVEPSLLARVADWRGVSPETVGAMAAKLSPATAPPIIIKSSMHVSATVTQATAGAVTLGAIVDPPGAPAHSIALGVLSTGVSSYSATDSSCSAGCRLLGLTIGRGPSAPHEVTADLTIDAIDGVHDFSGDRRWSFDADRTPSAEIDVAPGTALSIKAKTSDDNDALIAYIDTPKSLPAVLAGATPDSDPHASSFDFPGLADDKEPFTVVAHEPRLPRVGDHGLLFNLDDAVAMAERSGSLADATNIQYEVWASPHAPADLAARLSQNGVTVQRTQTRADYLDQLSRGAPTLGLWLYLFAGALALLLAIGVVLLGAYVGSAGRLYETAALKVTGVRPRLLRGAVIREYRSTLGVSLLVGLAAGIGGAVLMLPSISLVSATGPTGDVPYGGSLMALPIAIVCAIGAMALVVALALRMLGRATPERLREGTR
jgi:predicted lysophospholipase L1 biosynthesis ABC-type transport system permease subunit